MPCPLSIKSLLKEDGLPRIASRLRDANEITIVALGSSTTEGTGASRGDLTYPALVQARLRLAFPNHAVTVLNKGVGGETARQMESRLDRDVFAHRPDLVLWQTGTNEAIRQVAPERMAAALDRGVKRIRERGIDVLLIGPQHSAPLERHVANYPAYVASMRDFADSRGIPYFDRHAAMLLWDTRQRPRALLTSDNLHMNDEGYHCLGGAIAEAILCLSGGDCPEQ